MPRGKRNIVRRASPTSVRPTADCQWLWDELARRMGLSQTGVIELAVRRMAKEEGLPDPPQEAASTDASRSD